MKSYIAESIMNEYNKRKMYEKNKKYSNMQKFIKENCKNCKNKKTDLCHVTININNQLNCVYKEI